MPISSVARHVIGSQDAIASHDALLQRYSAVAVLLAPSTHIVAQGALLGLAHRDPRAGEAVAAFLNWLGVQPLAELTEGHLQALAGPARALLDGLPADERIAPSGGRWERRS